MSKEPNTLVLLFHKKHIVKETDETVMIQIDDARGFLEHLMMAFVHPNNAVVRRDDDVS